MKTWPTDLSVEITGLSRSGLLVKGRQAEGGKKDSLENLEPERLGTVVHFYNPSGLGG